MSDLHARLQGLLSDEPVTEKKMFGGMCFMHHGNMLCGITAKGAFMARVGKDGVAEAKETLPGARDMHMGTRKMGGMLTVDDAAIADDEVLRAWIGACLAYARGLPPK